MELQVHEDDHDTKNPSINPNVPNILKSEKKNSDLTPTGCQQFIHTQCLICIGERRNPIEPDPPHSDVRPGNDEASKHEEEENGHKANTMCLDHRAAHTTNETE